MPRYVAFLRAINVAGHGTVRMTELRRVFERAGAADVRTVIQSGNVVFAAPARDVAGIARRVRSALGGADSGEPHPTTHTTRGGDPGPAIMIRRMEDVQALVARDPFAGYEKAGRIKFYVAFLATAMRRAPDLPIALPKEALEAIAIDGREVFIVSRLKPSGFFGFPNNFIEDALGVSATTRNWSTVTAIARLAKPGGPLGAEL